MGNLSLWWHVIAELGNLAMWIFVLYFFVWKVLMLFLNQLRSWRQLMPPHLAIHAQDAVAGAESQSVSRRIPVEAVLGSQLSLAKQSSQTLQAPLLLHHRVVMCIQIKG